MADNAEKKSQAEEILTELLEQLGSFYKEKIEEKQLSAAEQKNLIQLLRDNQITVDPTEANPLDSIINGNFDYNENEDDLSIN